MQGIEWADWVGYMGHIGSGLVGGSGLGGGQRLHTGVDLGGLPGWVGTLLVGRIE